MITMETRYSNEVKNVISIILETAKKEILPKWGKVIEEEVKSVSASGYRDTVTLVDRCASEYILERVGKIRPGSYSEEHPYLDDPDRWSKSLVWHFDPVDGTAEFCAKMQRGYALNAALLKRQEEGNYLPVAGIIYRPGDDSLVWNDGSGKNHFIRNGRPIDIKNTCDGEIRGWVRMVDSSRKLEEFYGHLGKKLNMPSKIIPSGGIGASIVDLIEGKINLLVYNYNITREWDWAMALPMLKSVGGFVCDLDGRDITNFNRKPDNKKSEYYLRGVIASILFKKDEIVKNIPEDLIEDRLSA